MQRLAMVTLLVAAATVATPGFAADPPRFILELEAGPVWQTSNDVQIPNDESGTRFSLEELVGSGPWASGRLYATWNINQRHGLRLLLAPLSYTETGTLDEPVDFAGASYQPGVPTEATYRFNSWRFTWRYRLKDSERWQLHIGATVKIRDAEIKLRQGDTESSDDDLGFVPLLHLAAEYRLADRWRLIGDLDALGGGPGRAIDLALKLGYDVSDRWSVTAGYRTVEGGADTDDVYSFAWFNAAVVSAVVRF
ncbi:MAG TPA: hypothetical protein VLB51_13090 [Methylomirabilota bacterium]|nr:hypothetical protein [Methylomirabilota bacterium]